MNNKIWFTKYNDNTPNIQYNGLFGKKFLFTDITGRQHRWREGFSYQNYFKNIYNITPIEIMEYDE